MELDYPTFTITYSSNYQIITKHSSENITNIILEHKIPLLLLPEELIMGF